MNAMDNQRQGRRNQSAGKRWANACAEWLRTHGWPGAGVEVRTHSNDLTGTWDLAVECTITSWDKLWTKLTQAAADARARGLEDYCVWKKHNGRASPGDGVVIMPAWRFFPLVQHLERLEALELGRDDEYTRGFVAGKKYAEQEAREAV